MGTLPGIKVADNLFIGKEQLFTKHGVVDRKKMYQEARKALEKIGIDNIHPEDPIIKYSLEERKLIEVVRALYTNPRISSLTKQQPPCLNEEGISFTRLLRT